MFEAAGREQYTPLEIGIIFKKLYNIPCISSKWAIHYTIVVKNKIYSSKSVSYRFYSLHSSIMYSLFKDIPINKRKSFNKKVFFCFAGPWDLNIQNTNSMFFESPLLIDLWPPPPNQDPHPRPPPASSPLEMSQGT